MSDHYVTDLGWKVLTNVDFVKSEEIADHKTPWHYLSSEWRERFPSEELWQIENASYVIAISTPFTVDYEKSHSPIIYIGEGFAHLRFKMHLQTKFLPMLEEFTGAKFDFWVLPSKDKAQVVASEAFMLDQFDKQYGGKPLFNIQTGKETSEAPHPAWFQPLDGRRIGKRHWAIRRLD